MRYLFINGLFPQYSQTFVHDQIKTIKMELDGDVSVFARHRAPFDFEGSVPECAEGLLYAKPFDKKLARRLVAGALRRPLRAVKIFYLLASGKIDRTTFRLALQLSKAPDVAITHFGNNYLTGVQLKKHVFPRMKNVVVFHGHDISSYVKKNGWGNYRSAAPHIDLAIAVNKIWAEHLRINTAMRRVRTVYLGTDVTASDRIRNGDASSYSILFVGRFVEKKGFDVLYRAVKAGVAEWQLPVRVHCVGDGPLFDEMRRRTFEDKLGDTFVFYGSRQKRFVSQLMTECDLLVAPSRTAEDGDCEGLPVVLMEAMAIGIPTISTAHSGIPELIVDGETGLLVQEGNDRQLRLAISFAIGNRDSMAQMALAARAHVRANHDETIQARSFVEAIS